MVRLIAIISLTSLLLTAISLVFFIAQGAKLRQLPSHNGGRAIAIGAYGGLFFGLVSSPSIIGISWFSLLLFGGSGLLYLLLGVWDDKVRLGAREKLLFQLVITVSLLALEPNLRATFLDLQQRYGTLFLSLVFLVAVAWIVGITNAINIIDGIDGLAASNCALILISFLMVLVKNSALGWVLVAALFPAILAFLFFNLPPARAYLGNGGSLLLGHAMAFSSILIFSHCHRQSDLMVILLFFSYPILDLAFSIVRRLKTKTPIMQGDRDHIHHRLLKKMQGTAAALMCILGYMVFSQGVALTLFYFESTALWFALIGSVFLVNALFLVWVRQKD